MTFHIATVSTIPVAYTQTHKRAGIIPYRQSHPGIRLLLGVDTPTGEDTDLGGGVKTSDCGSIHAGIREFSEESFGIFGKIRPNELNNCLAVFNEELLIIFLPLKYDFEQSRQLFNSRRLEKEYSEIADLREYSEVEFIDRIINPGKMYERIRLLLYHAILADGLFFS